ncbi:MAG: Holliday junction resolvase RuvX [Gammaproteobacteria bacterium]|nr:Holliday junction resolvase RuvX [Gammaproteobacteria bacterium]
MPDNFPAGHAIKSILAFDFGLRRIGVAVGQTITGSASPLGVVMNDADGPDQGHISTLIDEWRPDQLVVGLPTQADGSPTDFDKPLRQFIADLKRFNLPVTTIDERRTSIEAREALKAARQDGRRGRIQKADIDTAAAVMIAERYLATL